MNMELMIRRKIMSKKVTCAYCKCRLNKDEAYVKHAGKHNTYYCSESEFQLAMERKKKREENKRRQQQKGK